jgi:hypothetical protein
MSRIALGAVHSAKLHSPAHTWSVIFSIKKKIVSRNTCTLSCTQLVIRKDHSTFSTLSLSVHVSRPSTIVNRLAWSYHSFQPCNYNNLDHCHREAYSAQATLTLPSLSTTNFRSLQHSLAKVTLHSNRLWRLASNFAYNTLHKLRRLDKTIRVN